MIDGSIYVLDLVFAVGVRWYVESTAGRGRNREESNAPSEEGPTYYASSELTHASGVSAEPLDLM